MNTIIVPVDFTEASIAAAEYTAKLFANHPGIDIVMYHMSENEVEEVTVPEKLQNLKAEMNEKGFLNISTLWEKGTDFIAELDKACRHRQASMVVMGVNEQPSIVSWFSTSNAIKMADNKTCPVLIIPPGAAFSKIENVMLTSDFKNVRSVTPSVPIKNVLDIFKPKLHVVNVNSEMYVSISEEHEAEKQELKEMFADYNPEFYFLRLYNVDDAIKMFAEDKKIDLIINIHKEHTLLYRLFAGSHTKNLVYSSNIPVLSVHE